MLKIATNFLLLASIFGFVIFYGEFNCIISISIFIFWIAILSSEVFSYIFFYKLALNTSLFRQNSFLNVLFSRKLLSAIFSIISGAILAFCFIVNILFISTYEFLFISLIVVALFLVMRFVGFRILKSEFKDVFLGSKKWIILFSAFVSAISWAILILIFSKQVPLDMDFFEFINAQAINSSLKCSLLNEIYAYSLYINSATQWFQGSLFSKSSILIFIFIALNKILFFVACVHFISFFFALNFDARKIKIGYFLMTIFTLCYITFAVYTASNLNRYLGEKIETKTEKTVKFILKNGIKFDINATDAQKFIMQLKDAKELNLAKLQYQTNSYIDKVYEECAVNVSQKVSEWNYSAMFDYIVLWHKIFGEGAEKYISEKFKEFIDESFPSNFNEELSNIVLSGIGRYEKDIKDIFFHYKTDENLRFDFNITNDFSHGNQLTRLGISGVSAVGITGALMAKMAGKTAAKTTAKFTASGASASSRVICGGAAIVCVPAFAVATWFGFDYIVAKGDEFLNRDELERKIYHDLMSNKNEFKNAFNKELNATFEQISDEIFQVK